MQGEGIPLWGPNLLRGERAGRRIVRWVNWRRRTAERLMDGEGITRRERGRF